MKRISPRCTASRKPSSISVCDSFNRRVMSREFDLAYGHTSIKFTADDDPSAVTSDELTAEPPLSDIQLCAAFDAPIASPPLDDIAGSDDSVLLVVSDATRATASAQVVNLLVRRLVQNGVSPANMAVI